MPRANRDTSYSGDTSHVPQTEYEHQLLAENTFLREQIAQRDERIAALEKRVKELEVLLTKALKNSSASSMPPSSDIVKPPKPPCISPDGKRKKGGQPGHFRHVRQPFTSEEIAETKKYSLERCPDCGGLIKPLPEQKARLIQQVEVIPEHIRVVEHRALAYQCTCCGKKHHATLPAPVKKGGAYWSCFDSTNCLHEMCASCLIFNHSYLFARRYGLAHFKRSVIIDYPEGKQCA